MVCVGVGVCIIYFLCFGYGFRAGMVVCSLMVWASLWVGLVTDWLCGCGGFLCVSCGGWLCGGLRLGVVGWRGGVWENVGGRLEFSVCDDGVACVYVSGAWSRAGVSVGVV